MMETIYHHCFASPHPAGIWERVPAGVEHTLCGLDAMYPLWVSGPKRFLRNKSRAYCSPLSKPTHEPPMCPECRDHPDFPLLLLGDLP